MPDRSSNPVILVVDDDPVVRTVTCEALREGGFEVLEAADGAAALEVVDATPPDLVVLDVEMPGPDGIETCQQLRQRPHTEDISILIATGFNDADTIDRAFEAGATDFVEKPVDTHLLQHRIRFLLRASSAFSTLGHTLTRLRDSRDLLANAQRLARIGNWEWVPDESEMLWSEEVYRIFGLEQRRGVATYEALMNVVHPEDRDAVEKALREVSCEKTAISLDHRIVTASGAERVIHHQAEVVSQGGDEGIYGTIQDITDRTRAQQKIRYLAYYDGLTGLPNRRMLTDHLERVLESAQRENRMAALLFLDVDRFKRVNDTLGHAIGDELLRAVANRMITSVRMGDRVGRGFRGDVPTVSRLGGDEFTAVLTGLDSASASESVARRILDALRPPFTMHGHEIVMSASIGIAVYPSDGNTTDALLRSADTAMYHAKEAGGDTYRFFSESMNERAMRTLRLESGLRGALERNEIHVEYQPLIDGGTGALSGGEALLRWTSPDFGNVPPAEFIAVAEECGLIAELGEWVLRTACAQVQRWRATHPKLSVSVNVSSHQVRRPGLPEIVDSALRESRLDPSHLELEITESALLGNEECVVETLGRLKDMGVRLALDDFGTGFSSLSHLVHFPIDTLKIDQSFVQDIGGPQAGVVIAAVLAMAHRLRLSVTAEGVETREQEEFLRTEGCDRFQGYRFSRPLTPEAFEALLRGQRG
jgi:diguanylate cyclase (GGDEF)-like protein/PAS domain S-box-containing protein